MQEKIGVLLINLGTPDSTKLSDVRKYLNQFLTDGRVIDYPWLPRQLLVRGIIVPFRSKNSAASYREIWTEQGSPLKFISEELIEEVQIALDKHIAPQNGQLQPKYHVELAMRYQSPSIESALDKLRKKLVSRYIVIPLFPQYASASTGSAHQRVMDIVSRWQTIPSINFINSYHNVPLFIKAFSALGKTHGPENYDHILFSFHGVPERHLRKADECNHCLKTKDCCQTMTDKNRFCYGAQCIGTAKALAVSLNIPEEKYTVCYQSRLGKEVWMQPYASDVIEELAHKGVKRILAFSPAFVADCLETIFEISVEYQEEFEEAGGEKIQLVESLNAHPLWVDTLKQMILRN